MTIDFSFSIEDWMDLFRQFFDIVINFFEKLGIKLFPDETEEEASSDEQVSA